MSDRQSSQTRWWRGFLFSQRELSDLGPLGEPHALAGTDWNRSRVSILSRLGPQAVVLWSLRRLMPTAMVAAMVLLSASLLLTLFAREASRNRRSNMVAGDAPRRPVESAVVEPTVDAIDREAANWNAGGWDTSDWNRKTSDAAWSSHSRRDLSIVTPAYSPAVPFSTPATFAPAASFSAPTLTAPAASDPFADFVRPAPSTFERP